MCTIPEGELSRVTTFAFGSLTVERQRKVTLETRGCKVVTYLSTYEAAIPVDVPRREDP